VNHDKEETKADRKSAGKRFLGRHHVWALYK